MSRTPNQLSSRVSISSFSNPFTSGERLDTHFSLSNFGACPDAMDEAVESVVVVPFVDLGVADEEIVLGAPKKEVMEAL